MAPEIFLPVWPYRWGFLDGSEGKEFTCNVGDRGDTGPIPGSRRFPWRRKWQPAPAFLPGKFHGQRSLGGYSPKGRKESDTTMQGPTEPYRKTATISGHDACCGLTAAWLLAWSLSLNSQHKPCKRWKHGSILQMRKLRINEEKSLAKGTWLIMGSRAGCAICGTRRNRKKLDPLLRKLRISRQRQQAVKPIGNLGSVGLAQLHRSCSEFGPRSRGSRTCF